MLLSSEDKSLLESVPDLFDAQLNILMKMDLPQVEKTAQYWNQSVGWSSFESVKNL